MRLPSGQNANPRSRNPRILVVTRRSVRKNKYVDFVGEYHLNLLMQNSAIPIMIPRTPPASELLDQYEPIHGVLIVEGEDIGPAYRPTQDLTPEQSAAIAAAHPSDSTIDHEKDAIEFDLVHRCLDRNIPILAICRGSQILNIAAGGDVMPDVDVVLGGQVKHIDYDNYDGHRHPLSILPDTPLHQWFDALHLDVNSYHHQGVSHLAPRFEPMAYTPDGLIEAFYDPTYAPKLGRFMVGLQFHPERMQNSDVALRDEPALYDYPGCPRPYESFVQAARAYMNELRRVALVDQAMIREGASVRLEEKQGSLQTSSKGIPLESLYQISGARKNPRSSENLRGKRQVEWESCGRKTRYSKEDLDRIMRSGGTVHGSTLIRQMLSECAEEAPPALMKGKKTKGMFGKNTAEWKKVNKGIRQAQKALDNLTGVEKMADALVRVQKLLSKISMNVNAELEVTEVGNTRK